MVLDAFENRAVFNRAPVASGGVVNQFGTGLHLAFIAIDSQIPVFVFIAINFDPLADRQNFLDGGGPVIGQHPNGGVVLLLNQGGLVDQHRIAIQMTKVSPGGVGLVQPTN